MKANTHIIQKKIVEIGIELESSAMELQNQVAQLSRSWSQQVLEELFDEMIPMDTLIRVDRLEVDLGTIDPLHLERTWKQNFKVQVKQALEKQLHLERGIQQSGLQEREHSIRANEPAITRLRPLNLWLFYLEKGFLPWWSPRQQLLRLDHFLETFEQASVADQIAFQKALSQKTRSLQKLINLASTEELKAFVKLAIDERKYHLLEHLLDFDQALQKNDSTLSDSKEWWLLVLKTLLDHPKLEVGVQQLGRAILKQLLLRYYKQLVEVPKLLEIKALPAELKDALFEQDKELQTWWEAVYHTKESNLLSDQANEPPINLTSPEDEVIYIDNAGLVLMNPFFSTLFKRLGLTQGSAFRSKIHSQKAMLLLEQVAFGHNDRHDAQRVLEKILCAWPIEELMDPALRLQTYEEEEVQKVLDSAIEYWSALGNSSPEALQATFLQRPGRLSYTDGQWNLKVESNSFDVLLGKLPWGFSLVKYPWMNEMLTVEWI